MNRARAAAVWRFVRRRISESSDVDLLTRSFFARFFDNELAGGSADLRNSFFWLIAFLAAPGIFLPPFMSFDWQGYALRYGFEALQVASRGETAFYLGFALLASGGITVLIWNSLLLDRRDSIVLGALPVRGRTIVGAKLVALFAYVLIITVTMHVLPSLSFGFFLAVRNPVGAALTIAAAHLVASVAAGAFVLLAVAAVQGLVLAAVGPRRFHAVSPWLQAAVVTAIVLGLVILPTIDTSTVNTLAGSGPANRPWLLSTPALWFLGLYAAVLGRTDPVLIGLSHTAMEALFAAAVVTAVSYPLAYRRLMTTASELSESARPFRWMGTLSELFVKAAGRRPAARASIQFFLASLARVSRHRLALAIAGGVALALGAPALVRWVPHLTAPTAQPPIDLLALPLDVIVFLLLGLRVAASLPADPAAGWIVTSVDPPKPPLRSGLWRAMFSLGVLPVTLLALPLYWRWGWPIAVGHVAVCLTLGGLVTEVLLWRFKGLPCSRVWRPEHANLRKWWPAYLGAFLLITGGLPGLEQQTFGSPPAQAVLLGSLVLAGVVVRLDHTFRRPPRAGDTDEPGQVQVLNLE
jgi:hypothetical protein